MNAYALIVKYGLQPCDCMQGRVGAKPDNSDIWDKSYFFDTADNKAQ